MNDDDETARILAETFDFDEEEDEEQKEVRTNVWPPPVTKRSWWDALLAYLVLGVWYYLIAVLVIGFLIYFFGR